jgi:predicted O-methyltransferase YrrM
MTAQVESSLRDPAVRSVLARLRQDAGRDAWRFLGLAPRILVGMLRGQGLTEAMTPESARNIYMPISHEQGELIYLLARSLGATRVVEFGTSFAISTLYLAAAVRDNGGGVVIGSELEPSKHARAVANLKEAGLSDIAEVRLGDALQTLRELPEPLDLVLLDGWKDLYLPVLELVKPRLRKGAVVLADNIFTFRKSLRPYVEHVQSGANGFESATLRISDGFELSVYLGP